MLVSGKCERYIASCMQLTQHTDYGLRLLMVLARKGEAMSLPAFAAEQNLSYHHVAKVAQALVRHGFAVSQRGRNGGIALARAPEEISIGEVVRALEPGMRLADCDSCVLRFDCGTNGYLSEALSAFLAVLDKTTLAVGAHPVETRWLRSPEPTGT